MSNIAVSFEKDGSDGLTHNVQRGRKGTQNGIVRILGYQVLFLGRLPGDHFNTVPKSFCVVVPPFFPLTVFTPRFAGVTQVFVFTNAFL